MIDYSFQFVVPKTIEPKYDGHIFLDITVINDLVVTIAINTGWVRQDFDYSLAGILNELGQPDEIWLKINTDTMDGIPHFDYDLIYHTKGIDIEITENATYEGNSVRICPQEIFNATKTPPGMFIWLPEEQLRFRELPIYLPNLDVTDYRLLEQLTDEMDTKLFFETYRDPKTTKCFRAPLDKIPGYVTPYP